MINRTEFRMKAQQFMNAEVERIAEEQRIYIKNDGSLSDRLVQERQQAYREGIFFGGGDIIKFCENLIYGKEFKENKNDRSLLK